MNVTVIGSGFGGLSAAIRLRAQGHDVTILEKRDRPGGRASVFERDGFTFDAGPTIITAPELLEELFALGGQRMSDHISLTRLDPAYNIRFEDGSVFQYHTDRTRLRREIARFDAADADGYDQFAKKCGAIFRAGMALIDKPFATIGSMLRITPQLVRLRADRSVAALTHRHFRDARLRQVFSFHPLLLGGNPFQTTSIYALIHELEQRRGVWFAMGGTGAVVRALVALFEGMRGRIEYSSEVSEIVVRDGRAVGVRVTDEGRSSNGQGRSGKGGLGQSGYRSGENGERGVRLCDIVVSNADVAWTYLHLVPAHARRRWSDARLQRQAYSMSLFVLYFGTTRRYPDMAHHEILMGPRYRELLADIFDRKVLAEDFSLYLHRPTATDPSLAPAGCDAWYVLSPVPHLGADIDWTVTAPRYRSTIVRYLEERYLPGLSGCIVSETVVDPRYFRDELNSHLGSAFSLAPVFSQSAWFRPHNASEDVENLYFAGAGTHPGAGLPGVISSGKIVANLVREAHPQP